MRSRIQEGRGGLPAIPLPPLQISQIEAERVFSNVNATSVRAAQAHGCLSQLTPLLSLEPRATEKLASTPDDGARIARPKTEKTVAGQFAIGVNFKKLF